MVERSPAKVGGRNAVPVTPISLRATMIMARENGGWKMKIKIKKKIKITHACRQRQIVGLVLILDPHLRQST